MEHAARKRYAVIAVATFSVALASREAFVWLSAPLSTLSWKASWLLLCAGGLAVGHRIGPRGWLAELGFGASWSKGLVVAFAASLPMLVSLMFAAHLSPPPVGALAMTAVVSPLTEEVLFRGYLIRQLHRRAGWPFLAAVAASAIVFGLMHLRQAVGSGNVMLVVMQVAITGGGGLFFGWMFVRSRDNVWLPFGMHAFMNLWWALFAVDTLAVGTVTANIGRGLTVVLAIVLVSYVFPLSTTTPAADKPLQPASGSDPPS